MSKPLSITDRDRLRSLNPSISQVCIPGKVMWLIGRRVQVDDIGHAGFPPRGTTGVMLSRADYEQVMGGART